MHTNKFEKLGLPKEMLKSIYEHGFTEPTDIQTHSIPPILEGKDVIAKSATGSGKTLAFSAAIISSIVAGHGVQALVLTPTRELAEQVSNSIESFSKYKKLDVLALYGGVSINPQINAISDADVIVGTPGRILDHLKRRTLSLEKIKVLVLDEADRMLDMGFIYDVKLIINYCSPERQTLLFSATISTAIAHIIEKFMKRPVEVSVESYIDKSKLVQVYYDVPAHLKFSLIVHLLSQEKSDLVMVFCNTQKNTDFVAKNLKFQGINALAIHGGFSQEKRSRTMALFNKKHVHVLVCTDVAARGLDIPQVSHVYNYDVPNDRKEYIHRIGRTARAGKEGIAVSLVSARDSINFSNILEDEEIKIDKAEIPDFRQVRIRWMPEKRGFRKSSRQFRGKTGNTRRYSRREFFRSRNSSNKRK